jgi:hypothetical protein
MTVVRLLFVAQAFESDDVGPAVRVVIACAAVRRVYGRLMNLQCDCCIQSSGPVPRSDPQWIKLKTLRESVDRELDDIGEFEYVRV